MCTVSFAITWNMHAKRNIFMCLTCIIPAKMQIIDPIASGINYWWWQNSNKVSYFLSFSIMNDKSIESFLISFEICFFFTFIMLLSSRNQMITLWHRLTIFVRILDEKVEEENDLAKFFLKRATLKQGFTEQKIWYFPKPQMNSVASLATFTSKNSSALLACQVLPCMQNMPFISILFFALIMWCY